MMEDSRLMFEIAELTLHSLNGTLDDSGLRQLEELLQTNPIAVEYYQEVLLTHVGLKSMEGISCLQEVDNVYLDRNFWQTMLQEERTAPAIEIPEEKPSRELIRKVVYPPREKRKVTKFQIFTLMMSAAAILFFVLFLRFAPEKPYAKEVATLVDQMNVSWADSAINFKNGDRLWTNHTPVGLDKGFVKIHYDDGVDVVIEGPAKFAVERSGVYIEYGRLFSRVSESGLGFLVETPTARFVDQGTEFGVQSDVNGSAELHVIKGKVQLFAGSGTKTKSSQIVTENEAVRYNANTGTTKAVPMTANAFVRSIDSRTKTVWHGETSLNLASIFAGHDGFREVDSLMGLNPVTGKYTTSVIQKDLDSNNKYNVVIDSDCIDGVFIPDGETGPVQVTSLGHTFDCPNTRGVCTHEITAYKGTIENQNTTIPPIVIAGQKFENDPVIMIHSNAGVTFDLQAIRQSLPQLDPKRFKARGALTEAISDSEADQPDVDFWVLVDGQVRYKKQALKIEDGYISFDIEFYPQDRFLTLIVTDGLRPEDGKREFPYGNDFFYLIDPELSLVERP